VPQLKNDGSS